MIPKEKAVELFNKYKEYSYTAWNGGEDEMTTEQAAIECANIAVDEILNSFNGFMDARKHFRHTLENEAVNYWEEVKKELSNL
jgi:hypothetical protein